MRTISTFYYTILHNLYYLYALLILHSYFQKRKLFELKEVSQGVKFYMFYDDVKKELYISLPVEKIVVKLDPSKNPILIDQVAGTGEHCKGNNPCGDNGKAVDAQLTYPKVVLKTYFYNY